MIADFYNSFNAHAVNDRFKMALRQGLHHYSFHEALFQVPSEFTNRNRTKPCLNPPFHTAEYPSSAAMTLQSIATCKPSRSVFLLFWFCLLPLFLDSIFLILVFSLWLPVASELLTPVSLCLWTCTLIRSRLPIWLSFRSLFSLRFCDIRPSGINVFTFSHAASGFALAIRDTFNEKNPIRSSTKIMTHHFRKHSIMHFWCISSSPEMLPHRPTSTKHFWRQGKVYILRGRFEKAVIKYS